MLSGGMDRTGQLRADVERFDPLDSTIRVTSVPPTSPPAALHVTGSVPVSGAVDVPLDPRIAIRLSRPAVLGEFALTLTDTRGIVAADVTATEGGRLLWLTPRTRLQPDTPYSVVLNTAEPSAADTIEFRTFNDQSKDRERKKEAVSDDRNTGVGDEPRESRWASLPPLQALPGETALAGQTLRLNGRPLADVTIELEGVSVRTDRTGRFLLKGLSAGKHELIVDGGSASVGARQYGVYEIGVTVRAGHTTALPYTIWMSELDTAHAVTIPSPTTGEVVITTPRIPGLEVRLPAGTIIKDRFGEPVTRIGITDIPLHRPPFPLPVDLDVPIYFTVQPGAAYVEGPAYGPTGARLIYPNPRNYPLGKRMAFWHYDPDGREWYVYGQGTVMGVTKQIVPDPGVTVYEFTGAMVADPNFGPRIGHEPTDVDVEDGDPVDLGTGLFVLEHPDLMIRDVLPISLTRTYRQSDARSRPFGVGATHNYEMFLVGTTNPWTSAELVLPDGGRVTYTRISPGSGFTTAIFEHTATPSRFQKSRITWNGGGWDLRLRDGTVYVFPDGENVTSPARAALTGMRDRNGNVVTLRRDAAGRLIEIVSPHGRWIRLTYDASNRITRADDSAGRFVQYAYDSVGRLIEYRDATQRLTVYTYDAAHQMLTIRDPRNIVYLTNEYNSDGRVTKQTQADGTTYAFTYTVDGNGRVTQTDATDPRGFVRRVTFNASGYSLTDTRAHGTPLAQTTAYVRQSGTNLLLSVTDALNRKTTYTYDASGNILTVTRLAETPNAVTTTFTYEPVFYQIATITDPLNHTTTVTYDTNGNPIQVTDASGRATATAHDGQGRPIRITDGLGNTTQLLYAGADLVQVLDPLGHTTAYEWDGAGRAVGTVSGRGHATHYEYDALNLDTRITDPLGGDTEFNYDANGNLLSLLDASDHATVYTYDEMDRIVTRVDALGRQEEYTYDANGNLATVTDRKGQVTTYTHDALDRRIVVTFDDSSSIAYTYDLADRLTDVADSANGMIVMTYDGLDRLLTETTAQGTVTYTYDAGGRRLTFSAPNQPATSYTYDDATRLTGVTRGSQAVGMTYDLAGRRSALSLPNNVTVTSALDAASRPIGLAYAFNGTLLGDLLYTRDADGNVASVAGSWARTALPAAVSAATYDAANQLQTWGDAVATYDPNGNLTSDGSRTLTWNARDQLSTITGNVSASYVYDGVGRRQSRTIAAATTAFLYDGLNVAQERTPGSETQLLSGLGLDEWFTRTDATGTNTFVADQLASTVALVNGAGLVSSAYTYEPFGGHAIPSSGETNAFTFTGRENDSTGLYFYRTRFYSPAQHRFTSEDPIGVNGGLHLYSYAFNRPTLLVDPTGEIAVPAWVLSIIAGCVLSAGTGITVDLVLDIMAGRKPSVNLPAAAVECIVGGLFGTLLGPGGDKLWWPKWLQKWTRPYLRLDRPHHGKGWHIDGEIPRWIRKWIGRYW